MGREGFLLSFLLTASVFKLRGSVIKILDEITNRSMCVQFSYNLRQTFNPTLKEKVRLLHMYSTVVALRFPSTINTTHETRMIYFSSLVEVFFGRRCRRAGTQVCRLSL